MPPNDLQITDVSDTSLWVAYYRAKETEREDALFRDPLAKVLVGERGKKIAESMKTIGRYTEMSVITRTVIIDQFIRELIDSGIDMVINLGAGLDTRPYRMNLPENLQWVEVDYPHIIKHKNDLLKSESPTCQLTRVALDLADNEKRKSFLSMIGAQTKKALILTEGVIPYLTEAQVTSLAHELQEQPAFQYWITEYFNAEVYKYMKGRLRTQQMKNAPFQFYPNDWLGFFAKLGWIEEKTAYSGETAAQHGRTMPMPWWAAIFKIFASEAFLQRTKRMTGYVLFRKST